MTKRERWTVYPLLTLCLLLTIRDRLVPSRDVSFQSVSCQELTVTTLNQERLVHLGENREGAGTVLVYAPGRRFTARPDEPSQEAPSAESADDALPDPSLPDPARPRMIEGPRMPVVEVSGERAQGLVRVYSDRYPTLWLGHHRDQQVSGLMATDAFDQLVPADVQFRSKYWGTLFSWDDFRNGSAEVPNRDAPKPDPRPVTPEAADPAL